jgi:hypothetical protein
MRLLIVLIRRGEGCIVRLGRLETDSNWRRVRALLDPSGLGFRPRVLFPFERAFESDGVF